MKKISMKTKIRFIIKTIFRPIGTKFEANYGNGFVVVNRFEYVRFVFNGLNDISKHRGKQR